MIQTIHTQCSRASTLIDTAMTAVGWAGFAYLATHDILSIAIAAARHPETVTASATSPTAQTLLIYLTVAAFNALVFVLWGTFRKRLFPNLHCTRGRSTPDSEITAAHFAVSRAQVHDIQNSRITTIHHGEHGEIAALETDRIRVPPASNTDVFDLARLA